MSRSDTIITLLGELEEIRHGLGEYRGQIDAIGPVIDGIDKVLARYRPEYPRRSGNEESVSGKNRLKKSEP